MDPPEQLKGFPQCGFFPAFTKRLRGHICNTTCHTLKQVKQNATNNLAPFFKAAFNALSDGVLRFAHCVAP